MLITVGATPMANMAEPSKYETSGDLSEKQQAGAHYLPSSRSRPLYPGIPTGTGLGKYRILERIGTSHIAIIYRARDGMLDRLVAIKQMVPALIDNPIACGHFKREAQFLARIPRGTRNIVGIHELIEDDLGLFIVEEYVSGQWLESLISKRQIDVPSAVHILKAAAQGLRTLHTRGIVHRGVQPRNIIVARNGRAKIANLATAAHESDTTPPPVIVPKYAAPELLHGEDYDNRIDIYSLGMVLFEMCVGRPVLNRFFADMLEEGPAAVAHWTRWHMDRHAALPNATDLNPLVPPRLSDIVRRMAAKDLDERFTSIQEILDELALERGDQREHSRRQAPGLPRTLSSHGEPAPSTATQLPQTLAISAAPPGEPPTPTIKPPSRQTSTHNVQPPNAIQPPVSLAQMAPPLGIGVSTSGPVPSRTLPRRHRPRQVLPTSLRRPPRIGAIPIPKPVVEIHKPRHPHLVARLIAASLVVVAILLGGGALGHYYYFGPGATHPIETVVSEGISAYEAGQLEVARAKLQEASHMDVGRKRFQDLQHQAELVLMLVQAAEALEENNFDLAQERLRFAQKGGANPSSVDDLQSRIWIKKDAYRLAAEGMADLNRGNLNGAEQKVADYEQKARAAGMDPSHLRDRLNLSRQDRKYAEAIDRATAALNEEEYDQALRACRDAESIKATSQARDLRKQITDLKERAEWILRGDEALLDKDFTEAASAYEKANQIEPSDEIEVKVRIAGAYVLYEQAKEAIARGDLLVAERNLRSSIWKYSTEQARTKLERMATAFEAARLVRKADRAMEQENYAEAERLYRESLPGLPPPADVHVKERLEQLQRIATSQRKNGTSKPED